MERTARTTCLATGVRIGLAVVESASSSPAARQVGAPSGRAPGCCAHAGAGAGRDTWQVAAAGRQQHQAYSTATSWGLPSQANKLDISVLQVVAARGMMHMPNHPTAPYVLLLDSARLERAGARYSAGLSSTSAAAGSAGPGTVPLQGQPSLVSLGQPLPIASSPPACLPPLQARRGRLAGTMPPSAPLARHRRLASPAGSVDI